MTFSTLKSPRLRASLCAIALALPLLASAQEAAIRKNLAQRIPDLPKIDEVRKTPMANLFEVRVDRDIFYTDADGNYLLINAQLMDTRARKNLTEERIEKLSAIDFKLLDTQNAITITRGNGKRQLAVFEDPNCGYCKRFEKDLAKISDVTVHVFLIPILGADSATKARQIWCAADKAKTWADWMQRDTAPKDTANCNASALDANLAFARQHRITGTPTLVFADGTRIPGAIDAQQIEQLLSR